MKAFLASVALLSVAALSSAQVVDAFSSFGTGESYATSSYPVGSSPFGIYTYYMPFTASASGALAGFRVAMGLYEGNSPQPFGLTLWSDAGGNIGTALGTFFGTSSDQYYGRTTSSDVVSVPASGLTLTAGAKYWLQASNPSTSSTLGLAWNLAPVGTPTVRYAYSSNILPLTYTSDRPAAFSVQVAQVQAVPEPVTMTLGAAAFGVALRRRRKA